MMTHPISYCDVSFFAYVICSVKLVTGSDTVVILTELISLATIIFLLKMILDTGLLYYSTVFSLSLGLRARSRLVSERNACNFQTIHLYVIKKRTLLPIKLTFHFLLLRGRGGREKKTRSFKTS